MKRNNKNINISQKKKMYESIMQKVAKVVKITLNEELDDKYCDGEECDCSDIPGYVDCDLYNDVCKYMDVVEFKKISNDIIAVTEDYGEVIIDAENQDYIFDFETEDDAEIFVENFKWEGTADIDIEDGTRVYILFDE